MASYRSVQCSPFGKRQTRGRDIAIAHFSEFARLMRGGVSVPLPACDDLRNECCLRSIDSRGRRGGAIVWVCREWLRAVVIVTDLNSYEQLHRTRPVH